MEDLKPKRRFARCQKARAKNETRANADVTGAFVDLFTQGKCFFGKPSPTASSFQQVADTLTSTVSFFRRQASRSRVAKELRVSYSTWCEAGCRTLPFLETSSN